MSLFNLIQSNNHHKISPFTSHSSFCHYIKDFIQ